MSPQANLRAPTRLSRALIGDTIEMLISILDAADGDPDLEPEEDFGADDQGEPEEAAE